MGYGITTTQGKGGSRVEIQCMHQNGLLYIVPAESSWVCTEELVHAHALAGFFKGLNELDSPEVRRLMQRWGIYFRARPLPETDESKIER